MLSSNWIVSRSWFMLLSLLALAIAASQAIAQSTVIVNGETLAAETVTILEQAYQTPLKPGRYWYDLESGLWGTEKGPATGQIHPGMKLGGPLKADASGGGTGVFFNGRELHPQDVAALYQFTGVWSSRGATGSMPWVSGAWRAAPRPLICAPWPLSAAGKAGAIPDPVVTPAATASVRTTSIPRAVAA